MRKLNKPDTLKIEHENLLDTDWPELDLDWPEIFLDTGRDIDLLIPDWDLKEFSSKESTKGTICEKRI